MAIRRGIREMIWEGIRGKGKLRLAGNRVESPVLLWRSTDPPNRDSPHSIPLHQHSCPALNGIQARIAVRS